MNSQNNKSLKKPQALISDKNKAYNSNSPKKDATKLKELLISEKIPSLIHLKTGNLLVQSNLSISSNKKDSSDIETPTLHSLKDDDTKFNKFFKVSTEKKFINQGKTKEVSEITEIQRKKSSMVSNTIDLNKDVEKLQPISANICPFKEYFDKEKMFNDYWQNSSTSKGKTAGKTAIPESILEKIGNERFSLILKSFLNKVYKNNVLSEYFKSKSLEKIYEGLYSFFYKHLNQHNISLEFTVSISNFHREMTISHETFEIFKGIFAITLREFDVNEDIVLDFLVFLEKARKHIVNEKSAFQKSSELFIDRNLLTDKIVEKIKKNSLVNKYVEKWDLQTHRKHLNQIYDYLEKDQLVSAIYLKESHKKLGFSSEILYHFKQIFIHALREFKISEELIFQIIDKLENLRYLLLNEKSYYEILCEKNDLNEVLKRFVSNIKSTSILSELFGKNSEEKLISHCRTMLLFCLKGPTGYLGCDITPSHINRKLSKEHYEAMRNVFQQTLAGSKFNEQDITYILADLDYYKYDIYNEKCLYDKIGSKNNIEFLVNSFYLKAFQHEKICEFFKNTDPVIMMKNQNFFFMKFLQSKTIKAYHFKDLRTFHLNMNLTEEHFKFFTDSFIEFVKELNVNDPAIIKEIRDLFYRTKNDVINKKEEND